MTALEKYIEDHPGVISGRGVPYPVSCPSNYGYLDDPIWCDFRDGRDCERCWNREIPGTENKEKGNDDMSPAAEYVKELEAKIKELSTENEKLKMAYETLTKAINRATDSLARYRLVIKTVEAMTDHDILEEF